MFRFIILFLIGFLLYRGIKSVFAPPAKTTKVKGKSNPKPKHSKHSINRANIEDASFKDIED